MKLHTLVRSKGLQDKANQRGRGNGTKGNTSGKGNKGQKARSGHKYKWSFEGGQTPLVQRMPKAKGFKRHYKLIDDVTSINISEIENNKNIESGLTIDKKKLVSLGIISRASKKVKILGNGEITKTINFKGIEKFSKTAEEKIKASGGTIS